jgi:hypothetical protein
VNLYSNALGQLIVHIRNPWANNLRRIGVGALLVGALYFLPTIVPFGSANADGIASILERVHALLVLCFIILCSYGLGSIFTESLDLRTNVAIERILFSIAFGLGLIGTIVFLVGISGFYFNTSLLVVAAILCAVGLARLEQLRRDVIESLKTSKVRVSLAHRIIVILLLLLLLITFLSALTPPWGYDSLMYHLEAPIRFLKLGRIIPIEEIWQSNGPILFDMLYLLSLALKSEIAPKLLHLTAGLLLALCIYSFTKRIGAEKLSLSSLAIFAAIPILPIWASLAYADLAWALFEFIAVYALINWFESEKENWLYISAVGLGFALGTKYLSLGTAAILGFLVLMGNPKTGIWNKLRDSLYYGLVAFLVASPWFLINVVRFGNPIFPLVFGGPGWPAEKVGWLTVFLQSFHTNGWIGSIALAPYTLFFARESHVALSSGLEFPSPIFLVLFLLPFVKRDRWTWFLTTYLVLRFLVWGISSQQTRLLLPLFPIASVLSAHVLNQIDLNVKKRWNLTLNLLSLSSICAMLLLTLTFQWIQMCRDGVFAVVTGKRAPTSYLIQKIDTFSAYQYIMDELPDEERVFFMWDGRGYYCDDRCSADSTQFQWSRLVYRGKTTEGVSNALAVEGYTHLLFSQGDLNFILAHDPLGRHADAAKFFISEYKARCTREVFKDKAVSVLEIVCD